MNSKIVIAAVGVVVVAAGIYTYHESSRVAATDSVETLTAGNTQDATLNTPTITSSKTNAVTGAAHSSAGMGEFQYVQDRLAIMRERRPNKDYDPDEVAAAMARTDAWTPLSSPPAGLPLSSEELADGREFIDFDSLKIETLVPGDTVKLAIDATGQQYDVKVDNVEKQDESRLTFSGHIEGYDGQSYFVSMTKGDVLTMGGIDTPDGHFTLQAHGDKGWVASSGALFKTHVEPIIPPSSDDQSAETNHTH